MQHLYTESIARRQRTMAALERTHHKSLVTYGNLTMSEEDSAEMTKRLYTDSVAQRQRSLDQRTEKAVEKQRKQAGCGRRFDSPEKERGSVRRLYDTIQRDREIGQKLFDKHNPPRPRIVRDPADLAENDTRFHSGQFGKKQM